MAEKNSRPKTEKDPFRTYEEHFVATPDPWDEIVRLDHGGDRTFSSTVRAMVLNAEPAQRPGMEAKLLAALAKPGLTDAGRMFVCRMLALIGTAAAVAALAPLVADPKTTDAARYALDAIDDPGVATAYRNALDKLSGPAKAGLIGSIALRRDGAFADVLEKIKASAQEPALVRQAATRALERLALKV